MSKMIKHISECCEKLRNSNKTLEDIYSIVFSHSYRVLAEYSVGAKRVEYTYAQAQADVEKISGALASRGIKDSYIGLWGENSKEWMVLFWAILRSGNKPYLMNLKQPLEFTKGIMNTLGVELVVSLKDSPDFSRTVIPYDELVAMASQSCSVDNAEFCNEFAISTSGTTLNEKICIYTGTQISAQLLNIIDMIKRDPDLVGTYKGRQKQLAFLPFYHIFGLEAVMLWYSFWGATFVFLPSMSPEAILHTVRKHQVTHIYAVPLLWNAMEKNIRSNVAQKDAKTRAKFERGLRLSLKLQSISPVLGRKVAAMLFSDIRDRLLGNSVQFCISGGSAVKESTLELMNALGYSLNNGYGMTEIGITSVELTRKVNERIKASIGVPFDSVEYRVGEDSKLFVKGSSVCKRMIINGEYQDNDEWFDTGDVMHVGERGEYYISGRISDVVFSDNGENLNPDLAEAAFSLSGVKNFSVLGNEDNSRLMLVVQIPEDMLSVRKKALKAEIDKCNNSLVNTYQVKEVKYTYDPIMRDGSIKVSRAYLRKAIVEGSVVLHDFLDGEDTQGGACESEIKLVLRQMFASILKKDVNEISDNGHFMNDLGGTSLDYFTLVGQIDTRFGVRLGFESDNFGYSVNDFERILKEMMG